MEYNLSDKKVYNFSLHTIINIIKFKFVYTLIEVSYLIV